MYRNCSALVVFALGLALVPTGPALATSQADLDLIFGSAVAPNVMIMFDVSGSMNAALWHEEYVTDPDGAGPLMPPSKTFHANPCLRPTKAAARAGTNGACPGSMGDADPTDDPCPENEYPELYFVGDKVCPSSCGFFGCKGGLALGDWDPDADNSTWYSKNYLNWLMTKYGKADTSKAFTDAVQPWNQGGVPHETRVMGATQVIQDVLNGVNPVVVDDPNDSSPTYTERVRFGLAVYDQVGSGGAGGYAKVGIADNSTPDVLSDLTGLVMDDKTPLSETLVDIGRYFAGTNAMGTYAAYDRDDVTGATTSDPAAIPDSPIDAECRQNFVVFMTDGEPTEDDHEHTYQNTEFIDTIGNADGDSNECAALVTACTDDPYSGRDDGLAYADEGTDWLDDVAFYLKNTDLIPDVIMDGDQTISTYTIGFTVDHPLLQQAADNGGGQYFTTSSAAELTEQLQEALDEIIQMSASFTSATVPSSRTSFDRSFFTAQFTPSNTNGIWAGSLQAYHLDSDGSILDADRNDALDPNGSFIEPRNPAWDASELLEDPNAVRTLYTTKSSVRTDFTAGNIDKDDLALSATEHTSYPNYAALGYTDPNTLAPAIVAHASGKDAFDEDADTLVTDPRDPVLGDIFHSNPVVVGSPPSLLLTEPSFDFDAHKLRNRVIYAGGNDGMLHAFDAGSHVSGDDANTVSITETGHYNIGTGSELFGYIPGLLLPQVKMLQRNAPRSLYFVDGAPVVADAWLGDPGDPNDITKSSDEWATVLVAGFRQGGAGYMALDVIDPTDPNYPSLLWEFTDSELGEAWSEPILTRVRMDGAFATGDYCGADDGDGDCREQWVAIFGGGYSAKGDPNVGAYDPNDLVGKAVYIVNLDDGSILASAKYDPAAADMTADLTYAFPSTPAVLDLDFDGFADSVYIGDLGGRIWKFDLTGVGPDDWYGGIFFEADVADLGGGSFHYRSFYYPPAASFSGGDLYLAFGSGERHDLPYQGTSSTTDENNRLYVLRDDDPNPGASFPTAITDSDIAGSDVTALSSDPDGSDEGFFIQGLNGEKFVTNLVIFGGEVITSSFKPATGSSVCETTGTSTVYGFGLTSGEGILAGSVSDPTLARHLAVGEGMPTDPRISIAIGESGGGVSSSSALAFIQTSSGDVIREDLDPGEDMTRTIFWRRNF